MAPSFTAQSLSKKCERGRREDRTEKSRAVNTGAKIHRFVGAAIHLCWQKHCRIIVSFSSRKSRSSYPISLRNRFLALAPAVRYGVSNLAALRLGCVYRCTLVLRRHVSFGSGISFDFLVVAGHRLS